MASADDVVSQLQNIVRQLSAWVSAFAGRSVFGTFTLGAAVDTVVAQPAVQANSIISWVPTNAAAGTLAGSAKSLYVKTIAPAASFTVSTASGVAAAGTETFSYIVTTPS